MSSKEDLPLFTQTLCIYATWHTPLMISFWWMTNIPIKHASFPADNGNVLIKKVQNLITICPALVTHHTNPIIPLMLGSFPLET
jgi:hypothetical protein